MKNNTTTNETINTTILDQAIIETYKIITYKKCKISEKLEKKVTINNSAGLIKAIDNIDGFIIEFEDATSAKAYKRMKEQGERIIIESSDYIITNENGSINKSQTIRKMYRENFSKKQIADALGIRYQFVYNVIRKDEDFMLQLEELEDDN
jgi:hypothetical protein